MKKTEPKSKKNAGTRRRVEKNMPKSVAVTDGEDKFHHYRSSVTDITEITRAETFRETEERYRALADSADSMYLVDRECRYQFMNDAHLLRLGVSLDQVKGKSYGDFHSEEDLKQFAATIEAVFETDKSFQTEHYGQMGDSFFLRTFSPVKNSQGNITAVTVISKDSTERKQAEEALRQSEERFRQLADATFEGIVIHDKGELLDFNQAMLKMFGYDHDEVIGKKNVMDFIAPESRELVLQHIAKGSEKPYEVMMVKKDGNTLAMEVAGRTISYKGRMARVVALRDVTERKKRKRPCGRVRRNTGQSSKICKRATMKWTSKATLRSSTSRCARCWAMREKSCRG